MSELTREQIERIAEEASDYDNWIVDKRDPEQGPAYPLPPNIARSLCDMALKSLDQADEIERLQRELSELRALYDAGCKTWNPVYEEVLRRAEKAEHELSQRSAEAREKAREHAELWRHEVERYREALLSARQQIEYLHDKFKPTGSGAQVIAQLEAALRPESDGGRG